MMSDPEKWEEIFKYTIDQTSPDQERKEQMWNRLQSTISGRGQKRKQVIRSGWQPHGRKTFAAALAGTVSYMPAVFGCYLAEYVIRRI